MRLQSLLRRLDFEEEEACGIAHWSTTAHVHLVVLVDMKWKSGIQHWNDGMVEVYLEGNEHGVAHVKGARDIGGRHGHHKRLTL